MARFRLYQRNGIWWVDGYINGKRKRQSTRETNRENAEALAAKWNWSAYQEELHGPEAVLTFGSAVGLYLDAGKSERYLTPIFSKWEHRLVKDIKPGIVHDLARELYPNAGPATRNRQVITPVQAVINHCAKRGLCPPVRIERHFVPKKKARVGDMDWLDAFMAEASPHLGALACFMAMTGARISEAIRLEWKDVDLANRSAWVGRTKNGEGREVTLPPRLVVAMANIVRKKPRVFNYSGRNSHRKAWATAEKRAGIEHIPPHDAGRRLFATIMLQSGIDVVTVAKAGGWKSQRMVLEVYAQPADARTAVEQVFSSGHESQRRKKGGANK